MYFLNLIKHHFFRKAGGSRASCRGLVIAWHASNSAILFHNKREVSLVIWPYFPSLLIVYISSFSGLNTKQRGAKMVSKWSNFSKNLAKRWVRVSEIDGVAIIKSWHSEKAIFPYWLDHNLRSLSASKIWYIWFLFSLKQWYHCRPGKIPLVEHWTSSRIVFFMSENFRLQVNIPKSRRTFCPDPKCNSHKKFRVTQYKKSQESKFAQGRGRYDRKQQGFGGQSKPILRKKVRAKGTSCGLRSQMICE